MALPDLAPDGSLGSLQVLSAAARGLVGVEGSPLLRPLAGGTLRRRPVWERVDGWIPRFRWSSADLSLTETVLAPPDHKGIVILLEVEARRSVRVEAGLAGQWDRTTYTLFHTRTLPVTAAARIDPWTRSVSLEALGPLPVVAWAVHPVPDVRPQVERSRDRISLRLTRPLRLRRGQREVMAFYVGVGAEADGARTTAVDLRRRGWETLLAETRSRLAPLQAGGSGRLGALYTLNLLFNRFFTCGRTIDTEQWVWVTSRSPRYYVCAAFWSRDAFLWSLPGLVLADRDVAREVVLYACRTHWRNAGMHAQYVDGSVIYPGFELDELAAFPVGVGTYLRATGDESILDDPAVRQVLADYPARLDAWRGPCGLHATFLDPSDDPVVYPYLTYDNVLAWRGLLDAAQMCERLGWREQAASARRAADDLQRAVRAHCIVPGPDGPMFAWAVDGQGGYQLYDNPPGSLVLLAHHGFCAPDDPVYAATVAWIRSPANPWYVAGTFGSPASAHSPDPWPMAAANDLLAGRADALQWLREAEMDGGIACETVDARTGRVKTGAAFATCAGLLAAALALHRDRWA
ncbi:MAG: glycoside hydrolase family 125 protein [Armatimonadota bacterium]|nr:glycoside hydrolase family 125 protein [Armatimonadota bacterium]MDR7438000.1 glycoside hydrolase family 125 protein [Armatimonadota bacterium]MDR7471840.1 glycoside hydrolase family 125 protein [Armatimonadota bacterium]MDR7507813.1 glycoside hydrolase family 125 protein [Armatimonadota bacterium]MDR7510154.1 glycoside hydrolase family 125 protein [Armatimonadota bacterium]